MTEIKYIEEKGEHGRPKIRVLVNGTDISDCVRSVSVYAGSGELATIHLDCVLSKADISNAHL